MEWGLPSVGAKTCASGREETKAEQEEDQAEIASHGFELWREQI